jgi:peroxiredoxin
MDYKIKPWTRKFLIFASWYNLLWGFSFLLFPTVLFGFAGLETPHYPILVQGVGGVVLIFALAYSIASRDPYRNWLVILMAFLLKLGAFLGTCIYTFGEALPQEFFWFSFVNDLIWLFPLGFILQQIFLQSEADQYFLDRRTLSINTDYLFNFQDQNGNDLATLIEKQPTLFVFLRQFGCNFCREAVRDLAQQKSIIEKRGTRIVVIHMSTPERAGEFCDKHGLKDISLVSDPDLHLYHAFQLSKGTLNQLLGWKTWLRSSYMALFKGIWPGKVEGDYSQLPGAFLLHKGEILQSFRHSNASDRPDYLALAECSFCP